jgi:hypothetical protein
MAPRKTLLVVLIAVIGAAIGVFLANWRFVDPDVVLGARVLFGVVGAVIAWGLSRWLLMRNAVSE